MISISFLVSISIFSQSRKDIESEWSLYRNNNVKSAECRHPNYYEKTSYDSEGKPTSLELYDMSGTKTNMLEFTYDSQNNLVKESGYIYQNGRKENDEESSRSHDYDVFGNRIHTWQIEFDIEYIYDSNGLLVESKENGLDESSKLTYRYNDKNHSYIVRIENSDGSREIRHYVYDDFERLVETRYHHCTSDWKAKDLYIIESRSYHDNGLLKTVTSNKEITEEYSYKFYEQ